jgi:hypothetical protein
MALIESALPLDTIVAFSDVDIATVEGRSQGSMAERRNVCEGKLFYPLLYLKCFVPRDFTFSRRAYELAGGFEEGLSLYEDWDFKLRLARFCEFRYTGSIGVAYRANPAGLSRAPLGRHLVVMRKIAWKNTAELAFPRRVSTRSLALFGILRFLKGGYRIWLKTLLFR